jgi:hypothetical protein
LVIHPNHHWGLLFHPFGSTIPVDDTVIFIFGELAIEHTTEIQGYLEWHWGRKFCSSSKGVATQVPIQLRIDKEREQQCQHWIVMEQFLDTSSGIGDVIMTMEEMEVAEDEPEPNEVVVSVEEQTRLIIKGMIKDDSHRQHGMDATYCQSLIDELKNKEHSSEIVAEMVKQMGGKVTKGDNPN